jgi:hypothetical protein
VPAGAKVELLGADGTVLATTAVLPFAAKLPTGVPGD